LGFPNIIHQIWVQGAAAMPQPYRENSLTWTRHNPGWAHRIWDDQSLRALMEERAPEWLPLFVAQPEMEARADVGRYALLQLFGGVYADMDTECRRPIAPLLARSEARLQVTTYSTPRDEEDPFRHATNSVIASAPAHPVWTLARRQIEQNPIQLWTVGRTGPEMLRPILRQHARENAGDIGLIGYPGSITTFSMPIVCMRLLSRMHRTNCVLDFNDSARRIAAENRSAWWRGVRNRFLPFR
jgi:mannosyltransferase OCH1-like enzyme